MLTLLFFVGNFFRKEVDGPRKQIHVTPDHAEDYTVTGEIISLAPKHLIGIMMVRATAGGGSSCHKIPYE
jgi:hypothetical protein